MKKLFLVTIITTGLTVGSQCVSIGQETKIEPVNAPEDEYEFKTEYVRDRELTPTSENPIVIKTPNKSEVFKIWSFTKIFVLKSYSPRSYLLGR